MKGSGRQGVRISGFHGVRGGGGHCGQEVFSAAFFSANALNDIPSVRPLVRPSPHPIVHPCPSMLLSARPRQCVFARTDIDVGLLKL